VRQRWGGDARKPRSPLIETIRASVIGDTRRWSYQRLSKDYEYLTATSEAEIYLAMTRLLLRRLTQPMSPFRHPLNYCR
jgi:putative transposase